MSKCKTQLANEIERCSKCGKKGISMQKDWGYGGYSIWCENKKCGQGGSIKKTEEFAIKTWNKEQRTKNKEKY